MKNKRPQAIWTRRRKMTITTPPSWPSKFIRTKSVAKNFPQFQDMFMYSLCSFHLKKMGNIMILESNLLSVASTYCNHIRIPSSRKVAMRQRRASVGRIRFPRRWTCGGEKCQQHKLRLLVSIRIRGSLFCIKWESETFWIVILMMWNLSEPSLGIRWCSGKSMITRRLPDRQHPQVSILIHCWPFLCVFT